jgi:16S rRNA (cytidine1402-2'-O)-methyltransferase
LKKLHLLTVPIGNLKDLSERGLEYLKLSSLLICEDTRETKNLLNHLGIEYAHKEFLSFHEHSKDHEIDFLLSKIEQHELSCLVSDAGSPMISDPAFPLIRKALESGFGLETIPGVSSVIVALELSGLPPMPFYFHGFLDRKESQVKAQALEISSLKGTHIYFESPHRILDSLEILCSHFPNSQFAVARELTKKFQEVYRFEGKDFSLNKDKINPKGEFVLLVSIDEKKVGQSSEFKELAESILANGAKPKLLAKLIGQILDRPTQEVYEKLNTKA